ncbi:MAG: SGNH/GDSL hydrolase family protein [Kiritimatiellae bacterium]|nr:SGNH/GDSL hydrolase family protein [Kiritimatiellia bacterium]
MKRKALVFVLAALVCVAIAGGGRAVAGESGRGVLQRGVAAQEVVDVVNFTAEPLFVVGETRITGAGGLLGKKSNWVADGEVPDFVTMLIGTNDINHKKRDIKDKGKSSEKAVSEIYESWKKLVDAVAARWPDAKIVCGTILDRDFYGEGPIGHELAVAVNDLIRADCKAGRLPKNFVLVDLYEKCPLAEEGVFFKDKLHPNWKGHMLMAEAFFDAIRSSPGNAASDLKK